MNRYLFNSNFSKFWHIKINNKTKLILLLSISISSIFNTESTALAQSSKTQFDVLETSKRWESRGGVYSSPEVAAQEVCNSLPACGPKFTVTQFTRENCATARFRCSGTVMYGGECTQYVEYYLLETATIKPESSLPRNENGAWCPGWNPYQGQKSYLFDGPYGSGTPQTGWAFSPGKQDCKCRRPIVPHRFEGCTAGNPVAPGSGLKTDASVDYTGQGVAPLNFNRTYRSSLAGEYYSWQKGGWTHNYSARLIRDPYDNVEQIITAVRPDGVIRRFKAAPSSGTFVWTPDNGTLDTLTEIKDANGATTGFTYKVFADSSLESYSPTGVLLNVSHANGWVTSLEYSSNSTSTGLYLTSGTAIPGLLIAVKNPFGRQIRFVYDNLGRLVQLLPPGAVKDAPAGSATSPIRYAYNEPGALGSNVPPANQLTSVTWQDGTVRRYVYENALFPHNLSGIVDETGARTSTYLYDAEGRVSEEFKAGQADRLQFSYSGMSESVSTSDRTATYKTTVTDFSGPNGAATSRTYDYTAFGGGVARPVAVSAPCPLCGNTAAKTAYGDGTTATGGAGAQGQKIREIAHDGQITFYIYNAKGQETERSTFASGYQSYTTRPALNLAIAVTSTQWHGTFNLTTQIAQPGQITSYSYSAKGMLTGLSTVATTDPTGAAKFSAIRTGPVRATGYGYNANSLNTAIVERTDGVETQRWTMSYNASGDLTKITDVTGAQSATITQYTADGRILRGTTDQGIPIAIAYSPRGAITQITRGTQTARFTYNPVGTLIQVRTPDNQVIDYVLDATQATVDIKVNGASISAQMLALGEYPDSALKGHIESARQALIQSVEGLLRSAHAQVVVVGGGNRSTGPMFDPRSDMLMSPISEPDKAVRAIQEAIARACRCDPNEGFAAPKFTAVTYAHVFYGGHVTPMFSDKSTFAPTEKVGQALVDEVIARATKKTTKGTRDEYNVDMGRMMGMRYDKNSASSDKRVPTQWITMIVERSNCSSFWRANEVVTLYPDDKRP